AGVVPESDIKRRIEGDAEYVFLEQGIVGSSLVVGLSSALEASIEALPIPKLMRYQTDKREDVQFVRPVHGLLALHGKDLVPVYALGQDADCITHGHRFQGAADVRLANADEYEVKLLEPGGVIASFEKRRADIERQLLEHAKTLGAELRLEERGDLLSEVTALVEYPTVYVGEFASAFLKVPPECLILTMQQNQRYFPLFDNNHRLLNKFLLVSNMKLDDARNIVEGNERVIRPRLADAKFFFDKDTKTTLASRVATLGGVVYHQQLGTQLARVLRVKLIAGKIASLLGADVADAERAAELSKADLLTDMVGEFPELQGVMGKHYARHDGEKETVAIAIEEHYRPRFAGDELPAGKIALSVALADKIDTLVGLFSTGQVPTGDKDPFGLRRQAFGVIRMLFELQLPLDIMQLLDFGRAALEDNEIPQRAAKLYAASQTSTISALIAPRSYAVPLETVAAVYDFILERLRGYLRELGFEAEEIEAVVAQRPTRIDLVKPRIEAVRAFRMMPEAAFLAAANKRTRNILKKADGAPQAFSAGLLADGAERRLHAAIAKLAPEIDSRVADQDYTGALKQLAGIRDEVDRFFDDVLVMGADPAIRANRLGLLAQLEKLMNQVADISKLAA
ncbi:MAG: glycine--tRNA ligase subunit beta, partial [Burkholderiales bacterium]|nr:glycine--tRNA ligase subunit beta [Burkholderiales bacterium]